MRILLILSTLLLTSSAALAGDLARGEKLAQANCGECHSIGATGDSTNPKSPPFRTLGKKYPIDDLEESLAEGILVGHQGPEMPQYEFSPAQIEDLLDFMKSVQEK